MIIMITMTSFAARSCSNTDFQPVEFSFEIRLPRFHNSINGTNFEKRNEKDYATERNFHHLGDDTMLIIAGFIRYTLYLRLLSLLCPLVARNLYSL